MEIRMYQYFPSLQNLRSRVLYRDEKLTEECSITNGCKNSNECMKLLWGLCVYVYIYIYGGDVKMCEGLSNKVDCTRM